MKEKVQLTENAMNSIENGAVLYEKDTKVESIALLVKGRVELVADGISMVLGTGNFLGACDVGKELHSFTYYAKDDCAVFVIPVQGMAGIERILAEKPDYRGLLVTSLNYFLAEIKKQLQHLREENESLCGFIKEKYELCDQVATMCGFEVSVENALQKVENSMRSRCRSRKILENIISNAPKCRLKRRKNSSAEASMWRCIITASSVTW